MKYLLAYWLISNAQIVATPAPMEFNDKTACEAALQTLTDDWQGTNLQFRRVLGHCLAKDTPPPPAPAICGIVPCQTFNGSP